VLWVPRDFYYEELKKKKRRVGWGGFTKVVILWAGIVAQW